MGELPDLRNTKVHSKGHATCLKLRTYLDGSISLCHGSIAVFVVVETLINIKKAQYTKWSSSIYKHL